MTVVSSIVSVGTTATLLADTTDTDDAGGIVSVMILNADASASVAIGGASLVYASSAKLRAGAAATFDLRGNDALYGRATSGTVSVEVTKTGT